MLKLITILILLIFYFVPAKSWSLDSTNVDYLRKVELNYQVQEFLNDYIEAINLHDKDGVLLLYIYHMDDDYQNYRVVYEGY